MRPLREIEQEIEATEAELAEASALEFAAGERIREALRRLAELELAKLRAESRPIGKQSVGDVDGGGALFPHLVPHDP